MLVSIDKIHGKERGKTYQGDISILRDSQKQTNNLTEYHDNNKKKNNQKTYNNTKKIMANLKTLFA